MNMRHEIQRSFSRSCKAPSRAGLLQEGSSGVVTGLLLAGLAAAAVATGQAQTAATTTQLHGSGATFPQPIYQHWFESFSQKHPGIAIRYDAVGSQAGIERLKSGGVDFAASDMPLGDNQIAAIPCRPVHIPTVMGAVVPVYNVQGPLAQLKFTPEALAGIYLGKIQKWNDSLLRVANPGVSLPNRTIHVIHRLDGSGTSFVWTDYLSCVSAEWKSGPGTGPAVSWPTGEGAKGNEGVAELVRKTPDSIGYVEFIYAVQKRMDYGAVRNAKGNFVSADLTSIVAAAGAASASGDLRVSLVNAPGPQAYPIASMTWLLIPRNPPSPGNQASLLLFLDWMLSFGQKQCASLGYPPLPEAIAAKARELVRGLK